MGKETIYRECELGKWAAVVGIINAIPFILINKKLAPEERMRVLSHCRDWHGLNRKGVRLIREEKKDKPKTKIITAR